MIYVVTLCSFMRSNRFIRYMCMLCSCSKSYWHVAKDSFHFLHPQRLELLISIHAFVYFHWTLLLVALRLIVWTWFRRIKTNDDLSKNGRFDQGLGPCPFPTMESWHLLILSWLKKRDAELPIRKRRKELTAVLHTALSILRNPLNVVYICK